MEGLQNLDLLSVGIAIAATIVLGFTVYISKPKSVTNETFLYFAIVTAIWGIVNYFSYQFSDAELTLWLLRGVMFTAVLQAFVLYELFAVFPEDSHRFPRWYLYGIRPLVVLTAVLTLTPAVFAGITSNVAAGEVAIVQQGPGIILFGLVAIGLVLSALYTLIRKITRSRGTERSAYLTILSGVVITFLLIIFFNFIAAVVFVNPRYIPLGALFTFPFVAFTSYAILRHHIFNIKVAATALLVFVLSIVSFLEIILSGSFEQLVFRASVFALVLSFGVSLIRNVLKEVELRETIQTQARELETANQQQESLLHFISHEIKGYLTKNQAAFAAIAAGDFGKIEPQLQAMSEAALSDTRKGVDTVIDILDASNLKKGTVAYKQERFDLAKITDETVRDLSAQAKEKGLDLFFKKPVTGAHEMLGDEDKIRRHVIRNVIDNSIKYTPHGSVTVELVRNKGTLHLTVTDTGVGITPEDMQRLFTEGGHGKDSIKINVHSTGYGMFIAKSVTEAHGGKIWAESEGKDKGSRFIVEFPEAA